MKRAVHPTIDVLTSAAAWRRALPSAISVCRNAARAAFAAGAPVRLRRKAGQAELSVVLASDRAIRKLNGAFRKKDKPTNVLSFPAGGAGALTGPESLLLGDVVVAYGTVAKEARDSRKSLKDHLSHMVVHGVLHLLGYDHETVSDALTMERLETKILSQLGVRDPYHEPAPKGASVRKRGARRQT